MGKIISGVIRPVMWAVVVSLLLAPLITINEPPSTRSMLQEGP